MLNVEEQTVRIEQLYRQLTGTEPSRSDRPVAPIPPDANAEELVAENLHKLQQTLQGLAMGPQAAALFGSALPVVPPRLTVFENEQEWRCALEVPGVKKDDVHVQISQGILRITANRAWAGVNGEPQRPTYAESMPCRYDRAVPLPPFARCESADARIENGVLVVKVAKDPSAVRRDLKVDVS